MKYCLFVIMIFYGTSFNNLPAADKSLEPLIPVFFFSQQVPFYFISSVPSAVKLHGYIDLSFFRNQAIVYQYRYRLELPDVSTTEIDKRLIAWSQWTKNNLTEIIIPELDQEGGYKLIFEYMTPELGETKKFEKPFFVFRTNPKTNVGITESQTQTIPDKTPAKPYTATDETTAKTIPVPDRTPEKKTTTADKTTAKAAPVPDRTATGTIPSAGKEISKTATNTIPLTDNVKKGEEPVNDKQATIKDEKEIIAPAALPPAGNIATEPSKEPVAVEKRITPDYDKLLAEAIEKKDAELFRKSIQNGANCEIKGINGGNIFHILDETIATEELISTIKGKGISINETDSNGNSPLHIAILKGEKDYARSLIHQGADLNLKNNLELSPLHLAAFLNDDELVRRLLQKGAEIDIKGNSGYTPLHIVTELNHITMAKELLNMGAKKGIKTDQKLTPGAIAKIQRNTEMFKLIKKKGSYDLSSPESASANNAYQLIYVRQYPKFDFNLLYDKKLAKKRQSNKIIQIISVPVTILGSSIATYMNHEANKYYSLYKNAESENIAKLYYDKTQMYDTYTYISGGISLVSVYGFIHSTIRKKSISNKMYKTFN
jgi:ankyrin repeat protein